MLKLTFLTYVVFSLAIARAFAGIAFGGCPSTPNIADFDIAKYVGKWYNLQNFPVSFQNKLSCVTATYGIINSTTISVTNRGIDLSNNQETSINGTAKVPDPKQPNRLKVTFPISINILGFNLKLSNTGNYDVWATDYNNYALVYSCTSFGIARYEVAWILARGKQLDGETLKMLYQKLSAAKIDVSEFKSDPQSCSN